MIYILGTGYVAQAYAKYFLINSVPHRVISRSEVLYTNPVNLAAFLSTSKPDLLINAAGYTGKPNVDACEDHKLACLYGNTILPGFIGEICTSLNIPWIHVSSGCIYDGSKRVRQEHIRPIDVMNNPLLKLEPYRPFETDRNITPDALVPRTTYKFEGYTEEDRPNFTFRQTSSYYSGTKAMGEELLINCKNVYICRLRIPFNEVDSPRNYLTKLSTYEKLVNVSNSITQIDEFVAATYSLWHKQAPFGIYNVTNPGIATAYDIVEKLLKTGIRKKEPQWITYPEFIQNLKAPRSNCLIDSTKLLKFYGLTPVNEAIQTSIINWIPAT